MLVKKMLSASLLVVFAAGSSASFAETADGFFKEAFPRDSYDKGSQLPMVVWGGEVAYAVGGLFANLVAGVGSVTGTTAYDTFHSDFKAVLKAERAFTSETDRFNEISRIKQDPQNYYYSKAEKKMVYRHSGYPGGIKRQTFADLLERKPEEAVRKSIRGMLPKNRLGRQMAKKLKVYAGPQHPHAAQQPVPLDLAQHRPGA